MARGRTYTREFKLDLVRQVTTGQKRPAQLCREHNLAESILLRWRKEYEARGEAAFIEKQLSGSGDRTSLLAEARSAVRGGRRTRRIPFREEDGGRWPIQ